MKAFAGQVAAITGAAQGMGRALAVGLAKAGARLALSDVDAAGLGETARLAGAASPGHGKPAAITTAVVDVADRARVYAWADEVRRDHGGCSLIFNNAGVSYGATVEGADYADLEWIMGVNFWGVVHGTKAFLPLLREAHEGHVVNTSSLFGLVAFPGQGAYNATKFAVRGLTEALAIELAITAPTIKVTCVLPGGIKTNIARASRVSPSLRDLGVTDPDASRIDFERLFRVTAAEVAAAILEGVHRGDARVLVGADARAFDVMQRMLPAAYQRIIATTARRFLRRDR